MQRTLWLIPILALAAGTGSDRAAAGSPFDRIADLVYKQPFFPDAAYDAALPTQESLIGFPTGQRAATSAEIERCVRAWVERSDRARLVPYARSHEGKPLYYVIVTSPGNQQRIDAIRAAMDRLADPRGLSDAEGTRLIERLPAIAWLGFTIHGDETEGSDAALAVLYHLMAATDPATAKLLDDLVVIIDPVMNPDGRDRFLKMVAEARGTTPNVDDQSLLHTGYWPRGRGNHYLFDLNRDWILGVHPETRGRIRELGRWNPLLMVDVHGMGPQETYLFSPPREPINPNMPAGRRKWAGRFARDQAAAFDRRGWLYYTGEWNEEWYPGYSDAWAAYRGAQGILYEQARVAEDGVRRPGGAVLTYRESVHHHVVGCMANLGTLQANAKQLLRQFLAERRAAVAPRGRYADRIFALLPTANRSRRLNFLRLMELEGFELYDVETPVTAPLATDPLGRERKHVTLPAGTVLIPNRQPLAHLVAAMLEFDPRLPPEVLRREREELLRSGASRIYDTTAWNLTMMHALPAAAVTMEMPPGAKRYHPPAGREGGEPTVSGKKIDRSAVVAHVIDGADDLSVTAAARLLEAGLEVRVADRPFALNDHAFARGSVVVTRIDHRRRSDDWQQTLRAVLRTCKLAAVPVTTGLGSGELPDLGGRHFRRLEAPRIALLGRGGTSPYDYGAIWHLLDHRLGIRHSRLDETAAPDLDRYNVLIVPDRFGRPLAESLRKAIRQWVEGGGTLIAIGHATREFATAAADVSKARLLPDVLDALPKYQLAILRQWQSRHLEAPSPEQVWAYRVPAEVAFPWRPPAKDRLDPRELRRRDAWLRTFMPQGALLAARVDDRHWLTFGAEDYLPVMIGRQPVLMADQGVEAPIRLGVWEREAAGQGSAGRMADGGKRSKIRSAGWSVLPPGYRLRLRMSGLLWPEATHRLANAAYVTREALGRGQIILFASPPAFRGSTLGPLRVLTNAVVYGPGYGTTPRIVPAAR